MQLEIGATFLTKEEREGLKKGTVAELKDEGKTVTSKFGGERVVFTATIAGFEGDRSLQLNGTSVRAISKKFGLDTAKWKGKKIKADRADMGNFKGVLIWSPV